MIAAKILFYLAIMHVLPPSFPQVMTGGPAGGGGSISVIQGQVAESGSATTTITATISTGNAVFCAINNYGSTAISCSDDTSDTFTPVNALFTGTGIDAGTSETFRACTPTAGARTFTATTNGTGELVATIMEIHSLATCAADQVNHTDISSATATPTTGSITTTHAASIILGWYSTNNTPGAFTAVSPWSFTVGTGSLTQTGSGFASALVYQIVSSTGTYNPAVDVNTASLAVGQTVNLY